MKYTTKRHIASFVRVLIMVCIALIMIFPFLWVFSSSLKTNLEISQFPPSLLPKEAQWENFSALLADPIFWQFLRNTLLLIVGNTVGTLLSSSLVAYPLARLTFPGKNLVFSIIVATMMVPGITLITPQYMLFNPVGWLDTLLPMIVPAFFAYPYNVFLFRQFFRSIPKDLDEAACIDGCGKMGVFLRILLPLSRPVFITIGILSAVFWWNELTQPLIYVNSDTWKPLTVALMTRFKFFGLGPNTTTWNVLMAVSTLMILPPILLYLCASRYLVEGIKTSGMKG